MPPSFEIRPSGLGSLLRTSEWRVAVRRIFGVRLFRHHFSASRCRISGFVFADADKKPEDIPARIVWTRFCNSGGLFQGGCLSGFLGVT